MTIVHDAQGGANKGAPAPAAADSQSFTLEAPTVTLDVVPAPTTRPVRGVNAPDDESSHLQFKHMTAEGGVVFHARGTELVGTRMDYDPVAHEVKISGSEDTPVQVTDERGTSTFGDVTYDVSTGRLKQMHDFRARARR